eukprot:gb/GEZN01022673.1/.p1 GENE.gb/GEZN01022673.1/~~gb/GEZN01022673.1/.p1  ORF type:complete len:154 (-),score=6.46 gb/GEZN01022673.1/:115-576(-)
MSSYGYSHSKNDTFVTTTLLISLVVETTGGLVGFIYPTHPQIVMLVGSSVHAAKMWAAGSLALGTVCMSALLLRRDGCALCVIPPLIGISFYHAIIAMHLTGMTTGAEILHPVMHQYGTLLHVVLASVSLAAILCTLIMRWLDEEEAAAAKAE